MTPKDIRPSRTTTLSPQHLAILEAWNRFKAEHPKRIPSPAKIRQGLARHLREIAKLNPEIAADLLKEAEDFDKIE